MKCVSAQNDMNTFHSNIPGDENSDANSSANNMEDSPAQSGMKRLKLCRMRALIIGSNMLSVVAVVLSLVAIIFYKQAADELRTARENRGNHQ